jgi:hypothetical protein
MAPYFPPLTFVLLYQKALCIMCDRLHREPSVAFRSADRLAKQNDRHSTVQCHVEL